MGGVRVRLALIINRVMHLMRTSTLLFTLSIGCGWGCSESAAETATPDYRGIVLVTVDTLRADHLPTYGYRRPTAPFLDQLAQKGVVFTRATATVSHTAPSHTSMFTGLLPPQHGVMQNGDTLSPKVANMAWVLGDAGYETAAFTSAKFLSLSATGFQTVDCKLRHGAKTVDQAVAWLGQLDPGRPFFLWVHFFDVHEAERPYSPTSGEHYSAIQEGASLETDAMYDYLAELHGLPNPPADEPFPSLTWESVYDTTSGRPYTLSSRADLVAGIDHYDAKIHYVDGQIERLFEAVQSVDSGGPSLWVIAADHGEGLGSHNYRGHGVQVYQEQLRVPLIFHATDESLAPGRIDSLISLMDLFPTVVGALPGPPRELPRIEGVSLWPSLLGEQGGREDRVIFAQRRPFPVSTEDLYVVMSGYHKFILHTAGEHEFFDLAADPLELVNKAGTASAERYHQLLSAKLAEFQRASITEQQEPSAEVLDELSKLGYVR